MQIRAAALPEKIVEPPDFDPLKMFGQLPRQGRTDKTADAGDEDFHKPPKGQTVESGLKTADETTIVTVLKTGRRPLPVQDPLSMRDCHPPRPRRERMPQDAEATPPFGARPNELAPKGGPNWLPRHIHRPGPRQPPARNFRSGRRKEVFWKISSPRPKPLDPGAG